MSGAVASSAGLRIGCVAYLNARPLIEGLGDDLVLDHPANLAPALRSGALDAALLPVRAILEDPSAEVVDGVGIASEGPVFSVVLAHRAPLDGLRRVALDPASLTSSQLVRVVLERFLDLRPAYGPGPAPEDLRAPAEGEGSVKIGDQAIAFRRAHGDALEYLDLGDAWTRATGLPFIYALWCLRPGLARPEAAAGRLRDAMERGVGRIEDLVADQPDPGFAKDYLTRHIRHRIGIREKAGLARFAGELSALDVLPKGRTTAGWRWV